MTLSDYYNRNIPEYYDTMYLDGFTPTEIITAHHKSMMDSLYSKQEVNSIKITSEIKRKWEFPAVKITGIRRKRKNNPLLKLRYSA